MNRTAIAIALGACLAWTVLIVATRAVLLGTGLNAWAFTLVQLVAGGAIMIALAWRGQVGWQALRMARTWIYGLLRVVAAGAASAALLYVGAMQDTLLAMVNVPLAALVVLAWTGRGPRGYEWLGHGLIVAGILLLAANLPGGLLNPAVVLELIAESAVAVSTVLIERHPHNRTESIADRCLFTGIVLMVTALLLLAAWSALAALGIAIGGGTMGLSGWAASFGSAQLWLWGILVGAAMRGPAMYLSLWAIKRAGSVTYLAVLALLPGLAFALETAAAWSGLLPLPGMAAVEAAAGLIVIAGALVLLRARALHTSI
jgi:hypothetical protein